MPLVQPSLCHGCDASSSTATKWHFWRFCPQFCPILLHHWCTLGLVMGVGGGFCVPALLLTSHRRSGWALQPHVSPYSWGGSAGGVRAGSSQRRAAPGGCYWGGGGIVWRSVPAWHHSQQKIELPVTDNVQTIPPPYVVRTILVLGRPGCQPQFSVSEQMKVRNPPSSPPWAEHQFLHAGACGAVLASPLAEDAAVPLFLL